MAAQNSLSLDLAFFQRATSEKGILPQRILRLRHFPLRSVRGLDYMFPFALGNSQGTYRCLTLPEPRVSMNQGIKLVEI